MSFNHRIMFVFQLTFLPPLPLDLFKVTSNEYLEGYIDFKNKISYLNSGLSNPVSITLAL